MRVVPGRRRGLRPRCAAAIGARLILTLLALVWATTGRAAPECTPALARVVSVQGTVELRRAGQGWAAVQRDAALCSGDSVRVLKYGLAALRLSNETTIRLDQGTTLTLAPPDARKGTLIQQLSGGLHVMTRTPRTFSIRTPFVNANVEGTEFAVLMNDDSATVVVHEGIVVADNDAGSATLSSGQQATARRGGAPVKGIAIQPTDAVAWTLYFPSVFDYRLAGVDAALGPSAALYRQGRVDDALAALGTQPQGPRPAAWLSYRAGLLLQVGRLDEARPAIAEALRLDPGHSDAHALQAVVAVVENQKDRALELARLAVREDPKSPTALMALSYAEQAGFQLEAALAHVREAVQLDPSSALAHARQAELEMSLGRLDASLAAAQQAVRLNPDLAKTQTVLGFAHLTRIDTRAARAAFGRAIELDQGDPLPRLGLGLAKIREGALAAGREEIEIAAMLDPGNSLVRSYLGKAYYEELRDGKAAAQFALAVERDPRDPTPLFYEAVRKQAANRPVDALQDLGNSIALNDDRAVYRSRSLIADDKAARLAATSVIAGELGFEQWAIGESAKALAENPQNESAHRALAVAYARLPKHDIARVSEALQARLREPVGAATSPLQLSSDNLVILRDAGPSRLGTNEFNQLFTGDRVDLSLDVVSGDRGTWGDEFSLSGLFGRTALAIGQLQYKTNGFGANDEAEKKIYSFQLKQQLAVGHTAQLEVRHSELTAGETLFAFSPDDVFPLRIREVTNSTRLGGHVVFGTNPDLLWSAATESRERTIGGADFVLNNDTARTRVLEVQLLHRMEHGYVLFGLGGGHTADSFFDGATVTTPSSVIYLYSNWDVYPGLLSLQLGAAAESFRQEYSAFAQQISRHLISPKMGVIWRPQASTTVRAAAFQAVKRPFVGGETLEPTNVAGFNQFFTGFDNFYGDLDGTVSRRFGAAVDHKLSPLNYFGAEVATRRMRVPSVILDQDFKWKEDTARAYFYTALSGGAESGPSAANWEFGLSLEYENERAHRPQVLTGVEGILDLTTDRLPLTIKAFNRAGLTASIKTAYVRQRGDFSIDLGLPTFSKRDSAWLTDMTIEYKLARRLGTVGVGVRNLFNKPIDVIETDPVNPTVAKRRFVYATARLAF